MIRKNNRFIIKVRHYLLDYIILCSRQFIRRDLFITRRNAGLDLS